MSELVVERTVHSNPWLVAALMSARTSDRLTKPIALLDLPGWDATHSI